MAEVIKMPRMSDTMEEGVIVEWLKKVGEQVEPGDILAEVETDKATMELESYQEGTLLYVGVEKGDAVPVDAVLAIIGEKGEDYEALLKEAEKSQEASDEGQEEEAEEEKTEKEPEKETVKEETASAAELKKVSTPTASTTSGNGRLKASPLAKSMAEDKGVDLSQVQGSGDEGRIIKRDIEAYLEKGPAPKEAAAASATQKVELPKVVAEESYEEVKVSQMRKTIARRLSESKFQAPHFYLTIEIEMDKTIEARKGINEVAPVKISFNDIIVKCAAAALRRHPMVNASWLGDTIRINHHIHMGVAVAVDEGLLVPVIRFADNKSLSHISQETKELAEKARSKKLQPDEMQGNTFTISNLGMFGIEEFTAIINPPDSCIMAIGGIKEVPVLVDGELRNKSVMKVTMSCDHRVVDGATGAKFLQTFKEYLEDPVRILVF